MTTELLIATQFADASKKEVFNLHNRNNINWELFLLKTLVLKAINYNTNNYLTDSQVDKMTVKISNTNINL